MKKSIAESILLCLKLFLSMPGAAAKKIASSTLPEAAFALAFLALVVVCYVFKRPIHSIFIGHDDIWPETFSSIGRFYGDKITYFAAAGALLVAGVAAKSRVAIDALIVLVAAGLWCGGLTTVGQFVLAEDRPYSGGLMHFLILGGHGVSGHASTAAVLFWPLYGVLGEKLAKPARIAFAALLGSWAILVAWSRMWDDKHFLWNVMLGFAIGFGIGRLALIRWREITNGSAN